MRVYYFTSTEYGLDNIKCSRLKVSTFDRLNDPFELFCIEMSDKDVRERLECEKIFYTNNFGMICFSEDWRNPVQWGHYANNHTGLCLGFDIPDDELCKVNYETKRLDRNELYEPYTSHTIFSTKFKHWSYEKEHRLLLDLRSLNKEGSLYFKTFSEKLILMEIIVGCESSVSYEDVIEAIPVLKGNVAVKFTRPSFRDFRIVSDRRKKIIHV
ncbi:DUF2971 domain-containing protein [Photobacterium iliopiscarium]|uniref:DUF2971 domain-containing protein n=1 Tax=Photobacterium iliopiscarium TaxID=56192 RepID=UPI001E2B015C|nr:DUF2971 domain-containing protein [Photobacterium iliopiscarium]MCD9468941.1 hypothetical protein [Photobacterium iliopiscarium]